MAKTIDFCLTLKLSIVVFILQIIDKNANFCNHFNIYEQDKNHAMLSTQHFYNIGTRERPFSLTT